MKCQATAVVAVGLTLAGALAAAVCAQSSMIHVLSPGTTTNVQAIKDGQPVNVELRTARIGINPPSGRNLIAFVAMVREPQSNLYWWTYRAGLATPDRDTAEEPPFDYFLYFTGEEAVGFTFGTRALSIRDVRGRKSDFAAIQQTALADIERDARAIEAGDTLGWREVIVGPQLGSDFLFSRQTASGLPRAKITGVTRSPAGWQVTLTNPNEGLARVNLDDQFMLVNVRREPAGR